MSSDDMFVVMYKILAYLYQCQKDGVRPDRAAWSADALGIPLDYWKSVVEELVSHGYVKGVVATRTTGGLVVTPSSPAITLEGVQFAKENSMMAKARRALMDAKAITPFI